MEKLIPRAYDNMKKHLWGGRVTVLHGARRVGKTTLVQEYLQTLKNKKILKTTGDDIQTRNIIGSENLDLILDWAHGYDVIYIDEAQNIDKVGIGLKILIDNTKDVQIIVTGSASFDLKNKLGEPLTGRQNPLEIFPIAIMEETKRINNFEIKASLSDYLSYGMYPEVITAPSRSMKIKILRELVNSYLLKDLLALGGVKNPDVVLRLLTLLSFQIGSEVSINELSTKLGIDNKTVQRYLDLLEKCYVIKPLTGFSRNLRNELTKKKKYYFVDVGIRNAIIMQFSDVELRGDLGELWENFIYMEIVKKYSYKNKYSNFYFWRTSDKKEIDLIEEREGRLTAYEIKWSENAKAKLPLAFSRVYKDVKFEIINSQNFLQFISAK